MAFQNIQDLNMLSGIFNSGWQNPLQQYQQPTVPITNFNAALGNQTQNPYIGQQTKLGAPTGLDYANLALSGVQTLGGLWGAYQQNKMAKKQFNFTKDVTNTNLRNQISAFNTALADRAAARAQAGSASFTEADRDKYIQENRLYR